MKLRVYHHHLYSLLVEIEREKELTHNLQKPKNPQYKALNYKLRRYDPVISLLLPTHQYINEV